jgi:hypothetical protein
MDPGVERDGNEAWQNERSTGPSAVRRQSMSDEVRRDVVRRVANVVGAVFQILVPIMTGPAIGRVSGANSTLVVPADYAFMIWSPIFLPCLAYAVYQALPANRGNPLLRRIGWFSALAFFSGGVWELLFPAREFVLAQIVLVGIFAAAVTAYLLVQRGAGRDDRVGRWLVAPAFGLLSGWVTAATFVGFATTFVASGVFSGGPGEAVVGALLLVVVGAIACAVIVAGRAGPVQGCLAYAAAVLWALAGIVANQYDASLVTTGAAVVAAVPVVLALFGAHRGGDRVPERARPSGPEPPEIVMPSPGGPSG